MWNRSLKRAPQTSVPDSMTVADQGRQDQSMAISPDARKTYSKDLLLALDALGPLALDLSLHASGHLETIQAYEK